MAKRPSVPSSADQGEEFPLRVLRISPGENLTVVFRTARVTGCYTHFVRDRSRYCDPDCCKWGCPRVERFWKGYDLVDAFDAPRAIWIPWVLEITENLELDLRGRYARGQSWQLSRAVESKERKEPVCGKYLGVVPEDRVQPAFNFEAVLRSIFHVERISLDVRNPMPDRILVTARKGSVPVSRTSPTEEPATPEQFNRLREQLGKTGRNGVANHADH